MMRLRPCFTWIAFAFCLCVVCGAMVWMSATTLRLERAEFQLEQADKQNRHRSEQAEYQALLRQMKLRDGGVAAPGYGGGN